MKIYRKILVLTFFSANCALAQQSIPADVVDELQERFQERYPTSPEIVKKLVDKQVNAYSTLRSMPAPKGMSKDLFDALKSDLKKQFPDDFYAQERGILKQVDAFEFIRDFKPSRVPPKYYAYTLIQIRGENPNNYTAQARQVISLDAMFKMPEAWDGDMPDGWSPTS